MTKFKLMSRMTAVLVAGLLAVGALAGTLFAQEQPPHRFFGSGADGDEIGLWVSHGDHNDRIGSATVSNGGWYIDAASGDTSELIWTVNGENADATYSEAGETQTEVALVVAMPEPEPVDCPDEEGAMGDGELAEDSGELAQDPSDESAMADCPEDVSDEEGMGNGETGMVDMTDEEDPRLDSEDETHGYPETGSGGLADNGGVSAGLIGLLIAIGAVAITGLGLRRVRNRA